MVWIFAANSTIDMMESKFFEIIESGGQTEKGIYIQHPLEDAIATSALRKELIFCTKDQH